MQKLGIFSIADSFQITGRGLVAIGDIIEGHVKIGNNISVEINGERKVLKVAGIEYGNPDNTRKYFIGLLLKNAGVEFDLDLTSVKLSQQIAEVFE